VKFKLILTQLVAVVMACAGLWAQDYEPRSVAGIVTDSSNKPVDGAVVQLENQRTLEFRSYITQQGGKYHFFRLDANVDYELRATHNSVWSDKKKLSLFSSKKQKTVNLKLKSP
jgi:hypothetical protein